MSFGGRRSGNLILVAVLLGLMVFCAPPAGAQPVEPRQLTVGVWVNPPFVMKEGDHYTGMAIDLWEKMAARLGAQPRYVEKGTIGELVDATARGDVDVAVGNITVTRDRAERIDFTHPWFDTGLRVMVSERHGSGFSDFIGGMERSGHLKVYAGIALIILAATFALTLFDRRFDQDFPHRWRDGLAQSFYSVMSVASGKASGRKQMFGWIGRVWQGLWLVCGIAVLAYVTSSVTSVMTTLSLGKDQIHGIADLSGHPIGVLAGSVGHQYASETGLDSHPYAHVDEAAEALAGGRVDAIVGDAPVLEYFAHEHPDRQLSVVGAIFKPDKYAFGLPRGSDLARELSVELIGAHDDNEIREIRTRYFGSEW